jgi:hypothetical protein
MRHYFVTKERYRDVNAPLNGGGGKIKSYCQQNGLFFYSIFFV